MPSLIAILFSGCALNNFCEESFDNQIEYILGVSAIEIIDSSKIRVSGHFGSYSSDGPLVRLINSQGEEIKSNILGISDSIIISDEHFGEAYKVAKITKDFIMFDVSKGWSFPVSGFCNPGEVEGKSKVKPYQSPWQYRFLVI